MTENEKLDLLLTQMQGMKQDMTDMKQDMTNMKQDITELKQDMTEVKQDMTEVKQDITELKQKVSKTELILENEIRVNIQRVAEGHLDLSRNLHDAMKPSNEVEMLGIRVGILESDMRELKAKIS